MISREAIAEHRLANHQGIVEMMPAAGRPGGKQIQRTAGVVNALAGARVLGRDGDARWSEQGVLGRAA